MKFFEQLTQQINIDSALSYSHVLFSIMLSFSTALFISFIYKKTYKGKVYSQSFVHTIVMMCIVVSIVMSVIGKNIAVAFGLVGAFSIIRFRSAISDPKDIAYIFYAMASGVVAGLGYYGIALLFTLLMGLIILFMKHFNFGHNDSYATLKILVPDNLHADGMFDDLFHSQLKSWRLTNIETVNLGTAIELNFNVETDKGLEAKKLLDSIRQLNGNLKVSLRYQKYY